MNYVFALALQSVLCTFDWLSLWILAIVWLFHDGTRACCVISVLLMIANGLFAVRIPCTDRTFATRQERMANQKGHTIMLLFFAGLGPIIEAFAFVCSRPSLPHVVFASLHGHVLILSLGRIPVAIYAAAALQHLQQEQIPSLVPDSSYGPGSFGFSSFQGDAGADSGGFRSPSLSLTLSYASLALSALCVLHFAYLRTWFADERTKAEVIKPD
jgi:hypothetical protein